MRKETIVTISAEGRDFGKAFFLREMSAVRAEKWATRAILALTRSGINIPEDVAKQGLAAVAAIGLHALAGVQFAEAEPLLDEMMQCVQIIPTPSRPEVKRPLVEDDIEEISTLVTLRREILALHMGFLPPAVRSIFSRPATTGDSPNIQTSP
jgi:hypothetical protein